jgi:hypothetical protein
MNKQADNTQIKELIAFFDGKNKDTLMQCHYNPIKKWIIAHQTLLLDEGVQQSMLDYVVLNRMPNKPIMTEICSWPYLNSTLYNSYIEFLSPEIRKVWEALLWAGSLNHEHLEKQTGVVVYNVTEVQYYQNGPVHKKYELKHDFDQFKTASYYYSSIYDNKSIVLSMASEVRRCCAGVSEKPKEANLVPAREPVEPTTYQYFDSEQEFLLIWPRLLTYRDQGQIGVTGKERPASNGLTKIQRNLGLREFFPDHPDKNARTLRTLLLAGVAVKFGNSKKPTTHEALNEWFQLHYAKSYTAGFILPNVKGIGHIDNYYIKKVEEDMWPLFCRLPAGAWVSVRNIQAHVKYNILEFRPFSSYATEKLSAVKVDGSSDSIDIDTYHNAIEWPFILGSLFLYAALGLCDLAYDDPDPATDFSFWEGLRYVRRTALGDYLCGVTKSYDATKLPSSHNVVLSPDTLLITVEGNAAGFAGLMEPYAEKVGHNRFRTESQLFLKNIRSKKDLKDKIALFRQAVGTMLPPNWEDFFLDLLNKIDPFESFVSVRVFKIPPNNKALIQLVAQDPVLRGCVIKAEGFIIIVENAQYALFRRRLQEFGYLVT